MSESSRVSSPAEPLVQQELYPIREVARLTGINPVTLRAWERRYGLIQPVRTESGHRLYSRQDVQTVRSIQGWIRRGVPVSRVGEILARKPAGPRRRLESTAQDDEWAQWQERVREAVAQFDEVRLEQLYGQLFAVWPAAQVFQEVLLPVWQAASRRLDVIGRTSEWLFFDAFLRARVLQRLQLGRPAGAERVLLTALADDCPELELLVAGLLLGDDRRVVTVLPAGVPGEELGLVCERLRPRTLLLYASVAPGPEQQRQLSRLGLGLECPLALVGEAAELAREAFAGTQVACLGRPGPTAQRRLHQLLQGRLDT